ncbi:MAG TPA: protein kinase [Thermoanaerobaculia bacterium]|nr:protein kinase [Thermoanaerobaculia bacterium]
MEVVSPLGAGGMGEVYRGRDTRLDRAVAIKIFPTELARNAQRRLRFEREAKTISQLNHPNIGTLYDVGHENGTDFPVMELLEGQALATASRKVRFRSPMCSRRKSRSPRRSTRPIGRESFIAI